MTLRYPNGQTIEAVLLSRTEQTMRVALRGSDDIVELNQVNGNWVSDECDAVQVSFGSRPDPETLSEEDFICAPELAAKLIRMLVDGDENEKSQAAAVGAIAAQIV
jgi:hypothetical protein